MSQPNKWTHPPPGFTYLLLDRVDPAKNENRFYRIGWQPTLLDAGAVVRIYGRKGGAQRVLATPFDSLAEAWPAIRGHIRRRLKRGYQVVPQGEAKRSRE